ncbi:MAG: nucleotide sugar dehydrogenase [Thermoplasmata archaeon]|jgi:UDPglucose 6-dehydrogenase|nr:nucleotide sugar dehydrogenase [Thermoplasmata archaeon]
MRIAVAGMGYVGLSLATLLAQKNQVTSVDVVPSKVELVNSGRSPIVDKEISEFLSSGKLDLHATTDGDSAYKKADIVIVATPTNYDVDTNSFDTRSVESVLNQVETVGSDPLVIIKSTIPMGFTESMSKKHPKLRIVFSPEFLREGKALYDNLYPSRIVVGSSPELKKDAEMFAGLLKECALKEEIPILITKPTEAEAIKLFANTYLAVRVAYFNELDTFAEENGLDSGEIIKGVCLDPRIGDYYNNPSFGYGGYCLPKDTKQLRASFAGVPNKIIDAVVESNAIRIRYIAEKVMEKADGVEEPVIGVFRLAMKKDSDNFRESSTLKIMEVMKKKGGEVVVYEPTVAEDEFMGYRIVRDLDEFKRMSTVIVTNRRDPLLKDVEDRVFTRDVFGNN